MVDFERNGAVSKPPQVTTESGFPEARRTGLGAEGAAKHTRNHRIDSRDEPEQDQLSEDEKPHSEGREDDSAA